MVGSASLKGCLLGLILIFGASAPLSAQGDAGAAAYKAAVERQFRVWLEALWPEAQAAGVSRATFDSELSNVKLNWSLPHLVLPDRAGPDGPPLPASMRKPAGAQAQQAEFDVPARYFPENAIKGAVAIGRRHLANHQQTLRLIEERFQVPASIVVSIWGRETGYSTAALPHDAIMALATHAFMGRRQDYFRQELITGLLIIERGHATRDMMRGSWAGAMGHTQFMPTDFKNYAVDFTGNGKRDIWNSIPDALASAANSLKSQGWDHRVSWAYEVRLPQGFDCTLQGPDIAKPISEWQRMGVTRTKGRTFPPELLSEPIFLVLPAGLKGPAFLATNNFSVLKLYNNSDLYAIYVGHVADRMHADEAFEQGWQQVDRFTRDTIYRVQKVLVAQGHDVGNVDGLAGFKTRRSIGMQERKLGLPLSCYPNQALVEQVLKEARAPN
jgi:lytic murein transglycosylase